MHKFEAMQKILILLLFSCSCLPISLAQNVKQFDYQIQPVIDGNKSHFLITVEFKQKEQGDLRLQLPKVWGMDSVYGNTYEQSELTIDRDGKEMTVPFYAYILSQPLLQHIRK